MHCRRPFVLAFVVAVAAFSLLAAGCGGRSSPQVASVTSRNTVATTTTPNGSGLVSYSACMRSNGLPTFPDPDSRGEIPKPQVVSAERGNPAKFKAAQTACMHLLPGSSLGPQETGQQKATRLADGLSFARCMRSHGVSRFPDPTPQGQLSVEMVRAQGIDVHSPAVLRVVRICLPASHGALTPAKVRAALAKAGG